MEVNPKTGRLVKKCPEGKERSYVANTATCLKKCSPNKTRDAITRRCKKSPSPKKVSPRKKSPKRFVVKRKRILLTKTHRKSPSPIAKKSSSPKRFSSNKFYAPKSPSPISKFSSKQFYIPKSPSPVKSKSPKKSPKKPKTKFVPLKVDVGNPLTNQRIFDLAFGQVISPKKGKHNPVAVTKNKTKRHGRR